VTDGHYAFVVSKVQCGIGSLTSTYETGTPSQGQFCIVVLTMTNITNTPQSTPPSGSMTDTTGNTYDTTTDTSSELAGEYVYLGSNFQVQLEVNPGSHYSDVYVFDVPHAVQASTVTLHGDYGTTGATVSVKNQTQPSAPPQSANPVAPSSPASPTTSTNATSPRDVVEEYFAAINAGNYARAWSLGGMNIQNGTYDSFVQGFAGTNSDTVTIDSVVGDTVAVQLDATQTDGTHKHFAGTYTVKNGVITAANIQ